MSTLSPNFEKPRRFVTQQEVCATLEQFFQKKIDRYRQIRV